MAEEKEIQFAENETLVEKWDAVLELKGKWADKIGDAPKFSSDSQRSLTATMLESLEQTVLSETTVAGDIAVVNPVLIPLVRRITPSLIGPEIFGTQPMKASSGLIFYLRSLYSGQNSDDLKYGPTSAVLTLADGSAFEVGTAITSEGTGVGTVAYVEGNNVLVSVTAGEFVVGEGVDDAATFAATVTTVGAVYTNEAGYQFIFKNYSGPWNTSLTSYASTLESSLYETFTTHNEVGFTIESDVMVAKKRALKARFSKELEEDLRNSHGLNAEQLLIQMSSDEIVREMNREFLGNINDVCTSGNDNVYTLDYATLDGRYELEKYQNVVAAIDRIAFNMALRNRRGPANVVICNAKGLSLLRSTGKLENSNTAGVTNPSAGTFNGMKVLFDLFADNSAPTLWLGYKGGEADAGFFYGPYVPLRVDKGIGPEDNVPRMFFTTRYGIQGNKFGAENYYGKITMTGFPGYSWN